MLKMTLISVFLYTCTICPSLSMALVTMTLQLRVSNSEIMQTIGGATPLMYACQQCRENEVSEILTKQPYSVKDRDRTLKTPLHYCAENPNTSCAEAVLKIAPDLVNAQDENGYSTLHLAVIAGNKALIKLLIAKGADVNIYDYEEHSAVHWAIVSSEKEALEMIIRAGANPSTPDIHGGYPLHYAVQMCGANGSDCVRNSDDTVRVVETLLNFGVDVNVKDKDGRQPILWAASAGSADAVIHLVSGGACVEAADKDGLTALHCAASRGHTATLETLITLCGANVDVIDGNGCSALFYSVTLGHADATELLLGLGAEPNRQDRKGRTPAHCGAAKGQLETLRILQKHGGNLWLRNVKGDIPLHEAVASGRKDLVLWLLSQKPDAINISNNDGRSPLHIASMYNNTEMVKVLLDSKSLVNPVMRTSKGILMTPLNVALCKGHRSCGKYLQLHGGVPFSKVAKTEQLSVFAVRISPAEDMMEKTAEESVENLTPSPGKTSRDKTSTDIPAIETESVDKKKVYRRRKKKKSSSNVEVNESDSDESVHGVMVKTRANRRNGKVREDSHQDDLTDEKKMEIQKVQSVSKTREKGKNEKPLRASERSLNRKTGKESPNGKNEAEETVSVKKVAKPKPLPRNKSLGEHKTVNNLSPEDFPPLMQTINQLDTVTLEPEIDISRGLSENELSVKTPNPESSNVSDVEYAKEPQQAEKKEEGATVSGSEVITVSNDFISTSLNIQNEEKLTTSSNNEVEENPAKKEEEKEQKEEIVPEVTLKDEKSSKAPGAMKPNGGVRRDGRSVKSPGSKSSNDEGSTRRSEKPVKPPTSKSSSDGGSTKKEEKSQKSGSSAENGERNKKTATPRAKGSQSEKPSSASSKETQEHKKVDETKEIPPKEQEEPKSTKGSDDIKTPEGNEKSDKPPETNPVVSVEEHFSETKADVAPEKPSETKGVEPEEKSSETKVIPEPEDKPLETNTVVASEKKPSEAKTIVKPEETPSETKTVVLPETKPLETTTVDDKVSAEEVKKSQNIVETAPAINTATPVEIETKTFNSDKSEVVDAISLEQTTNALKDVSVSPEKDVAPTETLELKDPVETRITPGSSKHPGVVESSEIEILDERQEISAPSSEVVVDLPKNEPSGSSHSISRRSRGVSEISISALKNAPEENTNQNESPNVVPEVNPSEETPPDATEQSSSSANQNKSEPLREEIKPKHNEIDTASGSTSANENGANEENNPKEVKLSQKGETSGEGENHSPQKEMTENSPNEQRQHRTPRVSRLCRRHGNIKEDYNQISMNQLVQNTIRKYHMERGIFYQLLELKRLQIRAGRANEQVLVKRLADEYERSRAFLGMKHFTGLYKFKEFEKFLYEQLKALNTRRSYIIPEVKSYDDIDALSGFLKKSRFKIISDVQQPDTCCTCITQRCHHSACAYTSVPCSAYITNLRRHKLHKPKRECFFPRIEPTPKPEKKRSEDRPATLELIQGTEKHVITLPETYPDKGKRYYITFTIKGAPAFKEEGFFQDSKDYFKHRHAKSV